MGRKNGKLRRVKKKECRPTQRRVGDKAPKECTEESTKVEIIIKLRERSSWGGSLFWTFSLHHFPTAVQGHQFLQIIVAVLLEQPLESLLHLRLPLRHLGKHETADRLDRQPRPELPVGNLQPHLFFLFEIGLFEHPCNSILVLA